LLALGVILGFPIYKLISLSFERYGLTEIIAGKGVFVGLENFRETFTDPEFWKILERTLFFTLGMVAVSILVGTFNGQDAPGDSQYPQWGSDFSLGDATASFNFSLALALLL
jgi:ABC-type maltose transport system permease subunit